MACVYSCMHSWATCGASRNTGHQPGHMYTGDFIPPMPEHVMLDPISALSQFQHWTSSSSTGHPVPALGAPFWHGANFGIWGCPVPGLEWCRNGVQHICRYPNCHCSSFKIGTDFLPVLKLEHSCSQIVTVPILDAQFQNWMQTSVPVSNLDIQI